VKENNKYPNLTDKMINIIENEKLLVPLSHYRKWLIPYQDEKTRKFIQKARIYHKSEEYDYSKVKYLGYCSKICIICPKHGEFWQAPTNHVSGEGCPKCGRENSAKNNFLSNNEFILKAINIHGNFYDYSRTNYKRSNEKVCIICPEHGEFWQTPNNHLKGSGCPKCGLTSICESYVGDWFSENNIKFTHGFITDLKKVSKKIEIDYVIHIDETTYWIEYNGIQHYKFIKYLHDNNIEKFKGQLMRDEKVKLYCKKHSITLIEIPYIFNTRPSIFDFLDKVLLQGIDPNTLVDYESLFERPLDYKPYSENEDN